MELLDPSANGKSANSSRGNVTRALSDTTATSTTTSDTQALLEPAGNVSSGTDLSDNVSASGQKPSVFLVQVTSHGRSWVLKRSLADFLFLDRQCHTCVFDRRFSRLPDLAAAKEDKENVPENGAEKKVRQYKNPMKM